MNFRCATYGISGSILLLFSVSLFSQGYRVEGNVTDLETGHPISLATVYINGTTVGTITDALGNFQLDRVILPVN